MRGHTFALAAAALIAATPVGAADEVQPQVQAASQPAETVAPTVLASAAGVAVPAPINGQQASATPKRPRAARVTTCRCGGATSQR